MMDEKENNKKKTVLKLLISIGAVPLGALCGYKYLKYAINKEGSNLWFKFASLDELKNYREKIGEQFKNAGINNLSEKEYCHVETMKNKLDVIIGTIENAIFDREHPNFIPNYTEHGWYLSEGN